MAVNVPSADGHPRVVVAICTRNRPDELARLLHSLTGFTSEEAAGGRVVIVDNASNPPLQPDLSRPTPFASISVSIETQPGLTMARNRALSERLPGELLVFIGDDELPEQDWLLKLLASADRFPRSIIAGGVDRKYAGVSSDANGHVLMREDPRRSLPDGALLEVCGFGNVLLPPELLDAGVRFDDRYNLTGGEDTDMCFAAAALGFDVRWAPGAVVTEVAGPQREALSFRIRLTFAQAAIYSDVIRRHRSGLLARAAKSSAKLVISLFLLVMAPRRGLYLGAAGCGGLLGAIGYVPKRYS